MITSAPISLSPRRMRSHLSNNVLPSLSRPLFIHRRNLCGGEGNSSRIFGTTGGTGNSRSDASVVPVGAASSISLALNPWILRLRTASRGGLAIRPFRVRPNGLTGRLRSPVFPSRAAARSARPLRHPGRRSAAHYLAPPDRRPPAGERLRCPVARTNYSCPISPEPC